MQIVSSRKSRLGTMCFTLKIGKMRKAEEFITYPVQRNEDGTKVFLQSNHRWAELDTKTGRITLSARKAQYPNSFWLMLCIGYGTAEYDYATGEQLNEMLSAIRETSAYKAGNNKLIYCDNSNANLV